MKKKFILFVVLSLFGAGEVVLASGAEAKSSAGAVAGTVSRGTVPSPAERRALASGIFGKIYITDKKSEADVLVFVESSPSAADLRVRKTRDLAMFRAGQWHIVKSRSAARWSVYFVEWRSSADFSICYVESGEGPVR